MTRFHLHPSALILPLVPLLGLFSWWQTAFLWGAATLHELGHFFAFRICNCPVESVTLLPFGLCAVPAESSVLSPKDEVFCAAAGPVVNLFFSTVLLALPLSPQWEAARYFLYCNLSLFFINVLPILPLDGGRILFYSLLAKWGPVRCERVCKTVAVILLILLLYPVCSALWRDKNPSLLLIWGYLVWNTRVRRGSI